MAEVEDFTMNEIASTIAIATGNETLMVALATND